MQCLQLNAGCMRCEDKKLVLTLVLSMKATADLLASTAVITKASVISIVSLGTPGPHMDWLWFCEGSMHPTQTAMFFHRASMGNSHIKTVGL